MHSDSSANPRSPVVMALTWLCASADALATLQWEQLHTHTHAECCRHMRVDRRMRAPGHNNTQMKSLQTHESLQTHQLSTDRCISQTAMPGSSILLDSSSLQAADMPQRCTMRRTRKETSTMLGITTGTSVPRSSLGQRYELHDGDDAVLVTAHVQ